MRVRIARSSKFSLTVVLPAHRQHRFVALQATGGTRTISVKKTFRDSFFWKIDFSCQTVDGCDYWVVKSDLARTELVKFLPIVCLVCIVLAFPARRYAVTVEKIESSVADVEERMNSARARFAKNLESRLDRVLTSTATWNLGDHWHGKRIYPDDNALGLELCIHSVTGSQFTGVLIQRYANGSCCTSDRQYESLPNACTGNEVHCRSNSKTKTNSGFDWIGNRQTNGAV